MTITLDAATPLTLDQLTGITELMAKIEGENDAFEQAMLISELAQLMGEVGSDAVPLAEELVPDYVESKNDRARIKEKAKQFWEAELLPATVINADTGRQVGFNRVGRRKVQSSSGDVRKLQVLPKLKELIKVAKQFDRIPSYTPATEPDVKAYLLMVAITEIKGQQLPVRFVLREMKDSRTVHYDHSLPKVLARRMLQAAKEKGPAEASPSSDAVSSRPTAFAMGMGGDYPDSILDEAGQPVNQEKGPAVASPNPAATSSGPSGLGEGMVGDEPAMRVDAVSLPVNEKPGVADASPGHDAVSKGLPANGDSMGGDYPEIILDDAGSTVNEVHVLNLFIGEPAEIEAELNEAELNEDGLNEADDEPAAAPGESDGLSDDPNAPNYRFKDTGVVAGARKDMVTQQFRDAAARGQMIRSRSVDWDEIERNPREAAKLITKSNLFGKVDWAAVRERGMEPGAGFLIDRIYASVAAEPEDSPDKRRSYALGIETLRDRMESCDTAEQVTTVLKEIEQEMLGVMLSATESEDYKVAMAQYDALIKPYFAFRAEEHKISTESSRLSTRYAETRYALEKAERRRLKIAPDLAAENARRKAEYEAAANKLIAFREANPRMVDRWVKDDNGGSRYVSEIREEAAPLREKANAILTEAKRRNLLENPTTKAWLSLGDRFLSAIQYHRTGGSTAFAKHVASAKIGRIKDWSWAESDTVKVGKVTAREVGFQFKVAEKLERKGGRAVTADSTIALKDSFKLRDVQSGNWVLKDPASAAFHVQRSAEAFADLADLIGIPDEQVSMAGRLALAFGARGKGNAGFGGGASAHYEPVQRVINLTKMKGGGSLAHEWLHFIDNVVSEVATGKPSNAKDFASVNPDLLPPGELREAFKAVRTAMMTGTKKLPQVIKYTDKDYKHAQFNVGRELNERERGGIRWQIKEAANAGDAVRAVDKRFESYKDDNKRAQKERKAWRAIAVAYHDKNPAGSQVVLPVGAEVSNFAYEAAMLDNGVSGKYWSQVEEMMARAFQSWCEDSLANKQAKNDYLSAFADNKWYADTGACPFPEGEERTRINAAFTNLMRVIRESNVLGKAIADKAVLDAILPLQETA